MPGCCLGKHVLHINAEVDGAIGQRTEWKLFQYVTLYEQPGILVRKRRRVVFPRATRGACTRSLGGPGFYLAQDRGAQRAGEGGAFDRQKPTEGGSLVAPLLRQQVRVADLYGSGFEILGYVLEILRRLMQDISQVQLMYSSCQTMPGVLCLIAVVFGCVHARSTPICVNSIRRT